MKIFLKSVRFVEEVNIPGGSEKRGFGSFMSDAPPDTHDMWFDTDLQLVVIRHKSGIYSDAMTGIANVRDMGGLTPAPPREEPITAVEPTGTVTHAPEPRRTAVIEKGPAGKAQVGRVVVGDPEED